ncbi:MAG: phosphate-starvation-inducible protein PsiE [Acidiferrobacterales bacterium]|nr:phosphate-starvation-inducible PsiE family protein [Gammaproteobacteria bacterium]
MGTPVKARRAGSAKSSLSEIKSRIDTVGIFLVEGFQIAALFIIGATIVWAAFLEYLQMIQLGHATLHDILLLFIYLELGAMVGIYFKTERLPVQFLLYIAITVLTRFLAIDIKTLPEEKILIITGAILLLTLAVLVLRIGASRFPSEEDI